jgi:hypothetical protein
MNLAEIAFYYQVALLECSVCKKPTHHFVERRIDRLEHRKQLLKEKRIFKFKGTDTFLVPLCPKHLAIILRIPKKGAIVP